MRDLYDIHCHILPGVDDGAKDMDMALSMIEKEIDAGVETIILTPHFRKEMFEPDMEDIWSAYDTLVDETRNRNIRLYLGCEFHANMEMVETLDRDLRPTLADSRYVLTEFSSSSTRAFIKERADALLTAGYYPIIAHIERYRALRKDFYMEIRRSLGRFLSIFFIVAIGCAFFSGIRASEPDMRYSGDAYFDNKNMIYYKFYGG